jgi:putative DNA-invertase from lambdoid prophage Rac
MGCPVRTQSVRPALIRQVAGWRRARCPLVDRLGCNYEDVCDVIREFMRRGVVIRTVINNFTFDGTTEDAMQKAVWDALIGFATKAAQRAGIGIEHAKANDGRAYFGRKPSYTREQFDQVREKVGQQAVGVAQIARDTRLTRQTDLSHQERSSRRGGCFGCLGL